MCVVKESMFDIESTKKTTERMLDRLRVGLATSYPHRGDPQLLSALKRLTSVFGMGTGVAASLSPPDKRDRSLKTEDSSIHTNLRLDQSLDRLVSFSSTRRRASTHDLSTSSSLRGLS